MLPEAGSVTEVGSNSEWQLGPAIIRRPRSQWPASRHFTKQVPKEETRSVQYSANLTMKTSVLTAILHLHSMVTEVLQYTNSLPKALAILARFLAANKLQQRSAVTKEPSVYYLSLAEHLAFIMATVETDPLVKAGKLDGMAPYWSMGRWNTQGRLGKGAFKVLGVSELPILSHSSRLAELIMLDAHRQDHNGSKITLWRS